MATHEFKVRVLLFKESDTWVAQCLEHDIATQGGTIQNALDSLERTVLGQVVLDVQDGIEPLSEIAPAPDSYFETFERAYRLCDIQTYRPPERIYQQPIEAAAAIFA